MTTMMLKECTPLTLYLNLFIAPVFPNVCQTLSLYCVPFAGLDAANLLLVILVKWRRQIPNTLASSECRSRGFWRETVFQIINGVLLSHFLIVPEYNSRTVGYLPLKLLSVQVVPSTKHGPCKYLLNEWIKSFRRPGFNIYWVWAFCLTLVGTQGWVLLRSVGLNWGIFSLCLTLK